MSTDRCEICGFLEAENERLWEELDRLLTQVERVNEAGRLVTARTTYEDVILSDSGGE